MGSLLRFSSRRALGSRGSGSTPGLPVALGGTVWMPKWFWGLIEPFQASRKICSGRQEPEDLGQTVGRGEGVEHTRFDAGNMGGIVILAFCSAA